MSSGLSSIVPELVRQAGIRIGADQRVGDARRCSAMCARISFGAERAVQADRERRRVPDRSSRTPPASGPTASGRTVGDGAGDHHRHVDAARLVTLGDGVDRGLGVERVEDRLDQQQVGAAVEQPAHLLAIGVAQLVEGDGAEARIGHVRRDRGGAVGRPERAGDEARPAVLASAAGSRPRAPAARPRS